MLQRLALDRSGCSRLCLHQIFVNFNGHPLEPSLTLQQVGLQRGATLWLKANPAAIGYQMTLEDAAAVLESLPPRCGFGEGERAAETQKQVEAALTAALTPLYLDVVMAAPYRLRVASVLQVCERGCAWRVMCLNSFRVPMLGHCVRCLLCPAVPCCALLCPAVPCCALLKPSSVRS